MNSHSIFLQLIGELLFVGVLVVVADVSDEAAYLIIALLVGLWILWTMKNLPKAQKWATKFTQGVK